VASIDGVDDLADVEASEEAVTAARVVECAGRRAWKGPAGTCRGRAGLTPEGRNAGLETTVGADTRDELSQDPYPVYRRLRDEGACVWLDAANRYQGWVFRGPARLDVSWHRA
jgi:hypothetical protein